MDQITASRYGRRIARRPGAIRGPPLPESMRRKSSAAPVFRLKSPVAPPGLPSKRSLNPRDEWRFDAGAESGERSLFQAKVLGSGKVAVYK